MSQAKLIGAVGMLLIFLLAFFYTDIKAYERGKLNCEVVHQKNALTSVGRSKKVRNTVVRKTDKELDKALKKWYRD